jgi:hypothetical protein
MKESPKNQKRTAIVYFGLQQDAWAIVNNLRSFLLGAQKAGQSLAAFFGADLHGIP